jgi:hypothetical protein
MNILRQNEYKQILSSLRHPQQRAWIIFNPTSIGDTATVCALASAFIKEHGHAITMVVPPDHLPITQMYPNRFLRTVLMQRDGMLHIINNYLDANRFELDTPFCGHPFDVGDCRIDNLYSLLKYPGRGGISQTDAFRHILRLPWEARLERPKVLPQWESEARQIAEHFGIREGRSVILFPANSSPHPQFPDVFWETLTERLIQRGYMVFCNMRGGNFRPQTMPIRGSIPIEVSIEHALPLVRYAGRMISGAHGMQFLQLLGGQFGQMTVAMPISSNRGNLNMSERSYHWSTFLAQNMYPEMVRNLPFAEFSVPFDGPAEELKRVAVAIADESFDDPRCLKRLGTQGQPFTEEHSDWLDQLIEPAPSL